LWLVTGVQTCALPICSNEPSCYFPGELRNVLKLSDKRVAGLAVVGRPNAKSRDACYLVAIGGKADVAYNLLAVLLRKKSKCDNQSHYDR